MIKSFIRSLTEAKMTVVDFAVSRITGEDLGATDILHSRLNSEIDMFSSSVTSEQDMATIKFPAFNMTDGNAMLTLTISCKGVLQDFKGLFLKKI